MDKQSAVANVLKRRLLKEYGVDLHGLIVEDLALENLWLKSENKELNQALKVFENKKTVARAVWKILSTYGFPKKQRRLLRRLAALTPVSAKGLKSSTKTENLKSLLRDTNDGLEGYFRKDKVVIKSCSKDLNKRGYYRLVISAPAS